MPLLSAGPPPEDIDCYFGGIQGTLQSTVPEVIRQRIGTARNLAVYAAFSYDLNAVSVLWSLTCLEMALWQKFMELNPGPLTVARKVHTESIMAKDLPSRVRAGYRMIGMPTFNGSFKALVDWAGEQQLVTDIERLGSAVKLRNSFAHPTEFNAALVPGMVLTIFQWMVEVVNELWPLSVP